VTDDPFVTHRSLLFTVAYEMLGSAADAEDVVQETWLRWAGVNQAEVRDPRAYLAAVEKFMAAISTGDVQGLVEVLAPDVVLISDGGGLVAAVRKPISGAEKVVALLARAAKVPDFVATTAWLNGMPGARIDIGGAATAVSLVVEDGRITRIYAIRNPHKLGWLEKVAELRR
jgi:Sigma-70 region 2/SnoaL-like domain